MKKTILILTIIAACALPALAQITMPLYTPITVSNLVVAVPAGVTQVASDGYNVFKQLSLTNPISFNLIGIKNGSHYGFGIEANQADTNQLVSAGFGLFAVQTANATTGKTSLNFYDATINLSVQQVEMIPIINIPITLRIFSGPFVSLNGGVLMGEQSGITGDIGFQIATDGYLTLGGGVINAAGAAANGLASVMDFAHVGVVWKF